VAVRNWDLVGGNPAPGDPTAYDELAGALRRTSTNAENAHKRLSSLKDSVDDSIWKGDAADAFKEQIGKLPGDLQKLFESYEAAADAMAEYGRKLTTFQTDAGKLLDDAELAQQDEQTHRQGLDQALAIDPTTPTALYDQATEQARQRIRNATAGIDAIREQRRGAETKAVDGLGHAGDIGIQNKKWYQKALAAIADAAEFVAFALAVIAIVVVVVVLLTNPAGWAALGAALAAAGPLFAWSTAASGVALGFKFLGHRTGDQDVTPSELRRDAFWLGVDVVGGRLLKPFAATKLRITSTTLVQRVTEVRPILGVITSTGKALLLETRTTVTVVRVTRVEAVRVPLHLDTVFNTILADRKGIPDYIADHPQTERQLRGRPAPEPAIGVALGSDVSCSLVHTPIPDGTGR
jgi:uncharacterized protein YukE